MRGTIAWSHDLLTPEEQTFFRRLAVFVGGFTLEAAEAVVSSGRDLQIDVLDGVASLVEQSLLREEDGPGNEPRYLMLETVREFGLSICW
jgi:predicted ATPase